MPSNRYLASYGGKADANALYTAWGGANDLFAAAGASAQAQAIIGSAVTDQIALVGTLKQLAHSTCWCRTCRMSA